MTPNAHVDRAVEPHRLRISLDAKQAQVLAYALRIFCDTMRDAGDTAALDYAKSMAVLRRNIIDAL